MNGWRHVSNVQPHNTCNKLQSLKFTGTLRALKIKSKVVVVVFFKIASPGAFMHHNTKTQIKLKAKMHLTYWCPSVDIDNFRYPKTGKYQSLTSRPSFQSCRTYSIVFFSKWNLLRCQQIATEQIFFFRNVVWNTVFFYVALALLLLTVIIIKMSSTENRDFTILSSKPFLLQSEWLVLIKVAGRVGIKYSALHRAGAVKYKSNFP